MTWRIAALLVLVAASGFAGYRLGYSSGQDEARLVQPRADGQDG
jgi:hypothetical protein